MDKVVLPLLEPGFSTFHGQAAAGAILSGNPSVWNFFLNNAVDLKCNTKFLTGYSTLDLGVDRSDFSECPAIDKRMCHMEFLEGYTEQIIKNFLKHGFYVFFDGVDDYYMDGKTWFRERHFSHDGTVHGYDSADDTFHIYAYDSSWKLSSFKVPVKSFKKGRGSAGSKGVIFGIAPHRKPVEIDRGLICEKLKDYLKSREDRDLIRGILVHRYLLKFLDMHISGEIPYEKLDRRVFRLLWEHKRVMHERLRKAGGLDDIAEGYGTVVSEADSMRLLYAVYHRKYNGNLLPEVRKKLERIDSLENRLLREAVERMEEQSCGKE